MADLVHVLDDAGDLEISNSAAQVVTEVFEVRFA